MGSPKAQESHWSSKCIGQTVGATYPCSELLIVLSFKADTAELRWMENKEGAAFKTEMIELVSTSLLSRGYRADAFILSQTLLHMDYKLESFNL